MHASLLAPIICNVALSVQEPAAMCPRNAAAPPPSRASGLRLVNSAQAVLLPGAPRSLRATSLARNHASLSARRRAREEPDSSHWKEITWTGGNCTGHLLRILPQTWPESAQSTRSAQTWRRAQPSALSRGWPWPHSFSVSRARFSERALRAFEGGSGAWGGQQQRWYAHCPPTGGLARRHLRPAGGTTSGAPLQTAAPSTPLDPSGKAVRAPVAGVHGAPAIPAQPPAHLQLLSTALPRRRRAVAADTFCRRRVGRVERRHLRVQPALCQGAGAARRLEAAGRHEGGRAAGGCGCTVQRSGPLRDAYRVPRPAAGKHAACPLSRCTVPLRSAAHPPPQHALKNHVPALQWDAYGHGLQELAPAAEAAADGIGVLYNWEAAEVAKTVKSPVRCCCWS